MDNPRLMIKVPVVTFYGWLIVDGLIDSEIMVDGELGFSGRFSRDVYRAFW